MLFLVAVISLSLFFFNVAFKKLSYHVSYHFHSIQVLHTCINWLFFWMLNASISPLVAITLLIILCDFKSGTLPYDLVDIRFAALIVLKVFQLFSLVLKILRKYFSGSIYVHNCHYFYTNNSARISFFLQFSGDYVRCIYHLPRRLYFVLKVKNRHG